MRKVITYGTYDLLHYGHVKLLKRAKALGYDAIHDTVHEMAKDEARHGCGFRGLYNKYFK